MPWKGKEVFIIRCFWAIHSAEGFLIMNLYLYFLIIISSDTKLTNVMFCFWHGFCSVTLTNVICRLCFVKHCWQVHGSARQIIGGNLHSNFFTSPSNQCCEQQDVIDNDIEIDCLNPIQQFKVPKQILYIHAIQCRDRTWQELPIDKWNRAGVKRPISP